MRRNEQVIKEKARKWKRRNGQIRKDEPDRTGRKG
jgi:hypothetical protein